MTSPVIVIVPFFGPWPQWMSLFVESCRWNPTINWLLVGDGGPLRHAPANVRLIDISFPAFKAALAKHLNLAFAWNDPYKLCDLKPVLGSFFAEEIRGYQFWGYGDLDLVYGDIRSIYDERVFRNDVISSHDWLLAGHFALLRNTPTLIDAFRRVPDWRTLMSEPKYHSVDEWHLKNLFLPTSRWGKLARRILPLRPRCHFVEQYTTDLRPNRWIDGGAFPEEWYWRRGVLTNDKEPRRGFLYCHFSHWNSTRWTQGLAAPWRSLDRIVHVTVDPPAQSFKINRAGIHPLD